jgi:molecular chaperone DnaJ
LGGFSVRTTCPACKGQGTVITDPCTSCSGTGRTKAKRELSVKIPPGIAEGNRVRIEDEGEPGDPGAPRGDLYCFVHVEEHTFFERINDDLVCEVPVAFSMAALGAKIDVPTLNGTTVMTIPKGTQSGQIFRLREQGMPSVRGYEKGDILVRVQIETPAKISRGMGKVLKELGEIEEKELTPDRKKFQKKLKREK